MAGTVDDTEASGQPGPPPALGPPKPPGVLARFGETTSGVIAKLLALAAMNAAALWMILRMVTLEAPWWALTLTVLATLVLNWVYLGKRKLPLKYLVPGTIFLIVFQLYPFVYTFYIGFTNYGQGQVLTQEQASDVIERRSVQAMPDAPRFGVTPMADDGTPAMLLEAADGSLALGTAEGFLPLEEADEVVREADEVVAVEGFERLSLGEAQDRIDEFAELEVPLPDEGVIELTSLTQATQLEQRFVYDEEADALVDQLDGTVYPADPEAGAYRDPDTGQRLAGAPGWRVVVGWDNFTRAFTDERIRDPFLGVLVWTYVFALGSTAGTFALGLLLALVLNHPGVKGRRLWRALIIIPYALPTFLTALIWRGMMNRSFGVLNDLIGYPIPWLVDPTMAKVSVLLVNLWFGFPYMFIIITGALQSIPGDLYEAAQVDGASGWGRFRRITLPLLLVSTAPVLLATFAFNFNNFNVIYLVTGGNPPVSGAASPVGHSDILISYTYRIAFETGGGQDYGLGAVVAIVTFLMVAIISAITFRYIRPLEEVHR